MQSEEDRRDTEVKAQDAEPAVTDAQPQPASQPPSRMRPPIVLRDLCLRSRTKRSECTICIDFCPEEAIALEDVSEQATGTARNAIPHIDPMRCLICDLCCNICPTLAINSVQQPLVTLDLAIQKASSLFDVAYVTCSNSGVAAESESLVEAPCLGTVPPEVWFKTLVSYPNVEVYLPDGLCNDCPVRCGETLMMDTIAEAEVWAQSAMGLVDDYEELDYVVYEAAKDGIDRRGVITNLAKTARNVTRKSRSTDAVAEFKLQQARMRNSLGAQRRARRDRDDAFKQAHKTGIFKSTAKVLVERRRFLQETLQEHPENASHVRLKSSTTSNACIGCGECITLCPTGARTEGEHVPALDPLYCLGCGLCVKICPASACSLITLTARALVDSEEELS